MDMLMSIIEAVVIAFVLGAIVGAVTAVHFRNSHAVQEDDSKIQSSR